MLKAMKIFYTPKTNNNNKNDAANSKCPSPPRPKLNFVNLPSSVELQLPLPCSYSDLQPSWVLQRRPVPLLFQSCRLSTSSTSVTSSSLASDSPILTLTYDDESSSSSDSEQEFITPAGTGSIFCGDPVAVHTNSMVSIVKFVTQGRHKSIKL